MEIFNVILIQPIFNVLVAIYQLLMLFHIPYALGFAIILLTVIVRAILYPFISAQMKTSKKMQDIAPHLSKVKEKHKGDSARIQEETMKLYKEFGVNPAAGCLPLLVQLPIIWGLYAVLQGIVHYTTVDQINKFIYFDALKLTEMWDVNFFGIPLTHSPSQLMTSMGYMILLVPVITAALQYFQSKAMLPIPAAGEKPKEKKQSGTAEDFAASFQKQSLYIFPIMIGFFSYTLPVGLSLYWNTFSIFGIIQQQRITKAHNSAKKVLPAGEKNKKKGKK